MEENIKAEKEVQLFDSIKRAEDIKQQNLHEVKRKFLMEIIRLQDAAENVARLEKVQEKKRQLYLEKMNIEESRVEKINQTKSFQLQHRKKLQSILNYEKHTIMSEFERRRRKLFIGTFDEKDVHSILTSPSQSKNRSPPQTRTVNTSADLNRLRNKFNKSNMSPVAGSQTNTPKKNFFYMKRQSVDVS